MAVAVITALGCMNIIAMAHNAGHENRGIIIFFVLQFVQTAQSASITQRLPLIVGKFMQLFRFPKMSIILFHDGSVTLNCLLY
jgi:hypothetical protein